MWEEKVLHHRILEISNNFSHKNRNDCNASFADQLIKHKDAMTRLKKIHIQLNVHNILHTQFGEGYSILFIYFYIPFLI